MVFCVQIDALIKKGLMKNSKSSICWHVYGSWYRQNNEYDRAVKCYQNAIRIDPENLNILKDMANLQVSSPSEAFLFSRGTTSGHPPFFPV